MTLRVSGAAAAVIAVVLFLSGCDTWHPAPIAPELGGEAVCYVAPDPARCRLAHLKAGGYPFGMFGSDR